MRPLAATELLDAWERGLSGPAWQRTLHLLSAASSAGAIDAVATLSIGERDRSLMALREWTFGSQLASVSDCSACGTQLEWTMNLADLYLDHQSEPAEVLSLDLDRYRVSFRLPDSSDLAALAEHSDIDTARGALLERCVLTAHFDGQETPVNELPAEIVTTIAERMAAADPQADLKIDLTCPACGLNWQAIFDIESFFWSEINAWAQRILAEVHLLARAYGWRETDILNLSPWRRQFYLGLASA